MMVLPIRVCAAPMPAPRTARTGRAWAVRARQDRRNPPPSPTPTTASPIRPAAGPAPGNWRGLRTCIAAGIRPAPRCGSPRRNSRARARPPAPSRILPPTGRARHPRRFRSRRAPPEPCRSNRCRRTPPLPAGRGRCRRAGSSRRQQRRRMPAKSRVRSPPDRCDARIHCRGHGGTRRSASRTVSIATSALNLLSPNRAAMRATIADLFIVDSSNPAIAPRCRYPFREADACRDATALPPPPP